MKKLALWSLFIFALLLIPTLSSSPSDLDLPFVDEKVISEINKEETVSVIVTLKDKPIYKYGFIKTAEAGSEFARSENQKDILNELDEDEFDVGYKYEIINGFSGEVTEEGLKDLASNPDVAHVEYNWPVSIVLDNSAQQINANDTWAEQIGGNNIIGTNIGVCIIDTGIDTDHPTLQGRIAAEKCYCSITDYGSGGCCSDNTNESNSAEDDNGHGSHASGIIISNDTTTRGIAYGANIIAVKAMNSTGHGSSSDIISAIEWCENNTNTYNISVISMSLSTSQLHTNYCDNTYSGFATAIDSAVANNILVTSATGNDHSVTGIGSPACIQNVTAVGAVNDSDISTFNRNNLTDLLAPGVTINSTTLSNSFVTLSGTSMATPHVAATAALLFHECALLNINCSVNDIESAMINTGTEINDSGAGKSNQTYPRINVFAAYEEFLPPQITIVSPLNNSRHNQNITYLNISLDREINLANVSIDGAANQTMSNSSIYDYYLNLTNSPIFDETEHNISYWVNSNNNNTALIFFTIDKTPPAKISNLTNQSSGANWIYWNWSDPNDSDLDYIKTYKNGTNVANISNGTESYNATCLNANTTYQLGMLTADTVGNINISWVNGTASTTDDSSAPTINIISPVAGTSYSSSTISYSASVTDSSQIDWCGTSTNSESNNSLNLGGNNCNSQTSIYTSTVTGTSGSLNDGSHDVDFYCNDSEGNILAAESISFSIDTSSEEGGGDGSSSGGNSGESGGGSLSSSDETCSGEGYVCCDKCESGTSKSNLDNTCSAEKICCVTCESIVKITDDTTNKISGAATKDSEFKYSLILYSTFAVLTFIAITLSMKLFKRTK